MSLTRAVLFTMIAAGSAIGCHHDHDRTTTPATGYTAQADGYNGPTSTNGVNTTTMGGGMGAGSDVNGTYNPDFNPNETPAAPACPSGQVVGAGGTACTPRPNPLPSANQVPGSTTNGIDMNSGTNGTGMGNPARDPMNPTYPRGTNTGPYNPAPTTGNPTAPTTPGTNTNPSTPTAPTAPGGAIH